MSGLGGIEVNNNAPVGWARAFWALVLASFFFSALTIYTLCFSFSFVLYQWFWRFLSPFIMSLLCDCDMRLAAIQPYVNCRLTVFSAV